MLNRVILVSCISSALLIAACDRSTPVRVPEPAIGADKFGVDTERERELLLEADLRFLEASQTAGLAEAYRRFLSADAIQLMGGYPAIEGRENIVANVSGFAEEGVEVSLSWDVEGAEAAASGDLGYTWGTYLYAGPDNEGEQTTIEGKYVNIWRKSEGGQWEVALDIANNQVYWPEDLEASPE